METNITTKELVRIATEGQKQLMDFINSLPKEQIELDEPVMDCKDLEEAAMQYLDNHKPLTRYNWGDLMDAFKAGAEWGTEHVKR